MENAATLAVLEIISCTFNEYYSINEKREFINELAYSLAISLARKLEKKTSTRIQLNAVVSRLQNN